jgi:ubiquinone/menaquinone biosynthesis C-methylase UbiE
MDPLAETLATYDNHAVEIAEQWWDNRLERQMRDFVALLPGRRVADIGCGAGRDVEWLGELGVNVVGVELSEGMLTEARTRVPNGRFARATFTALPLATASVDGAWVCSSLVHAPPDVAEAAIGEISRILKPGGALYVGLEEGSGNEWRVDTNGARRMYYFWSAVDMAQTLDGAGLTVVDQYVEPVAQWHFLTTLATRRA